MRKLTCLIFGHKWFRYGFPTRDDKNFRKDDIQLFLCVKCFDLVSVPHNGPVPNKYLKNAIDSIDNADVT